MYNDMSVIREQTGEDPAKVAVYTGSSVCSELSTERIRKKPGI